MINYGFTKEIDTSFDETVDNATNELKKEGFGILTQVDVTEKFAEKLGIDFKKYIILGACNPPKAFEALQYENKIGTMLPCNVIVQELDDGKTEVAAVNPVASMLAVDNRDLTEVANEIEEKLQRVIHAL